jgi:rhamnulokinase
VSAKNLFAVDFGASGGKCFAGKFEGDTFTMTEVHRFAHEGVSFFLDDSTGKRTERTVWNDIHLYDNILKGLSEYSRTQGEALDSIGIDTWGADGQFVTADGDMLGKIYCYRDHRLDDMIDKVKACLDAKRIYELTGIHFQPFNASNQLLWFVQNRKSLLTPGTFYLPIPSVFYYYLGGVKKVDTSFASVTQLMDAATRDWSDEMLNALNIPREVMPEIVQPGSVVGELHKEIADMTGVSQAALVAVGSHDTASAFAAAPVENHDEALIISSGTWSLLGKLIPEPITSMEAMEAGISNEGGIGNIRFLKNCMGTWIVQELRRNWRQEDGAETSWKDLDKLSDAAPAFECFINPDDTSFYNPQNMQQAIVEFCKKTGQIPPQSRGSFLRTVYESLALRYRLIDAQISSACGKKTAVVHIVGGGSNNVKLNQFTADAIGVPVKAGPMEGTAVGNFMVQALGLGIISSMQEALPYIQKAFPIKDYVPQSTSQWDKVYDRFTTLCN